MSVNPTFRRLAETVREEFKEFRTNTWSPQEEKAEIVRRARIQGLDAIALETAVEAAWRMADDADEPRPQQGALFDLEGTITCGKNLRIAQARSTREHYEAYLKLKEENYRSVKARRDRERHEFSLLAPYWTAGGMTKTQARAAYEANNPLPGETA